MDTPTAAVLCPDDHRIAEAARYLRSLSVSPVADPMLTICPTMRTPAVADYCVFTSGTGAKLTAD